MEAIKQLLLHFKLIKFFKDNYPKNEFQVHYYWSPFDFKYVAFGIDKIGESSNPFSSIPCSKLKEEIDVLFPTFVFKEQMTRNRHYDDEFLLRFLIELGYTYPPEKIVRYLYNPISKEKTYVYYDENGKPYFQKNK